MPSVLQKCKILIVFPINNDKEWNKHNVQKWIEKAGGELVTTLDESVTHVICTRQVWEEKGELIEQALSMWNKGNDLKIVEETWLEAVLHEQKKLRTGSYLWNKPEQRAEQAEELGLKGSTIKMMREHVNSFVDEREKQLIKMEEEIREQIERRHAQSLVFKQAIGKKARHVRVQIFAAHNHIYTDPTGFKYEVLLRKVEDHLEETEVQEVTLRIFETNPRKESGSSTFQPPGFTTSGYSAKTQLRPDNHLVVARYVKLPTALRCFKVMFWELTGMDFDTARAAQDQEIDDTGDLGDQPDEHAKYRNKHFVYVPRKSAVEGLTTVQDIPQDLDVAPQRQYNEQDLGLNDDSIMKDPAEKEDLENAVQDNLDLGGDTTMEDEAEQGDLEHEAHGDDDDEMSDA